MKTNNRFVLAIAIALASSLNLQANPGKENPNPAAELKYAGTVDNNPLYRLQINATDNSDYVISVTDSYGYTFYREEVGKGSFTKTFLVNKEDLGNQTIFVKIINRKDKSTTGFEIHPESAVSIRTL